MIHTKRYNEDNIMSVHTMLSQKKYEYFHTLIFNQNYQHQILYSNIQSNIFDSFILHSYQLTVYRKQTDN